MEAAETTPSSPLSARRAVEVIDHTFRIYREHFVTLPTPKGGGF